MSSPEDLLPCPCCGSLVFDREESWDICQVCNWQDDPVQSRDPDFAGGANDESLNQAKEEWRAGRRVPPRFAPKLPG